MLCKDENALGVVGEQLDIGVLGGYDDIHIVLHCRLVNHLGKRKHCVSPNDRLGTHFKKGRLDIKIF